MRGGGGGVDFSSSISRRTRGQTDVYYRNLHEELKKSRLEAASSSGGISNVVASDVKVDGVGNGEKQDSVVDSSKSVALSISDDDSDSSAECVPPGDDSERSEEYSDDSFAMDERNMSSNKKRARITTEMQGSVKKGSAREIYNLSSYEEELMGRNKNKRNIAEKGKRRKLGRLPKITKISRDNEDNDDEYTLKKPGRPAKKKACRSSNDDVIEQLVDSIWKQKDLVDKTPVLVKKKAPYQSTLPLKFRFEEGEPSIPEKTESEKEIDSLMREMEVALWEPEAECTNSSMADSDGSCSGNINKSTCCDKEDVTLDEQIGVICNICSRVLVHIKDILPSMFVERREKKGSKELPASPRNEFLFEPSASNNNTVEPCFYSEETVLDLLTDSEKTALYPHQLEGFEFMWKKIAGDTHINNLLNLPADQGGGCIISHDPGTGKTRLSIVFIQTFMKLYPNCYPMILAPPGMLMTWEEEFQKWNVNITFINLNDNQLNRLEAEAAEIVVGKDCSQDTDRVRFAKLYSWMKGGSILGVSYNLFEQLAGENKEKPSNEKFRNILLEVPGLLLLDEGHTARNDHTLKWKVLTMVKTQRKVILSGTLFQNNFEELYNTLSLVNPRFPLEFVSVKKKRGRRKQNVSGWEISKSTAEKDQVMKLQRVMKQFVHVHKGDILQKTLPGIEEFVILLRPTDLQTELLRSITRLDKSKVFNRAYLANLVSIHPFNAASSSSIDKNPDFLTYENKLAEIELNVNAGVKTRFLIELIKLASTLGEKVLVFCENIEPLNHITKLLKFKFSWNEGQEVIHMNGTITGKKRQDCIKVFNDKTSNAKVVLASQRACSEGISLVGASRVVMLDVVWNPSVKKQAISRAYRLSQERKVYVYHLVVSCMDELLNSEMKKFICQAKKERISELLFSQERPSGDAKNNVVEDELLECIATHESLKGIFEDIVHHPKESDLLERLGC